MRKSGKRLAYLVRTTLLGFGLYFLMIDHVNGSYATETILKQKLFNEEHDPTVRPVARVNDSVVINIDMTLNFIVDLNEKLQVIQTEIWVRLTWLDPALKWNSTEFDGIKAIFVSPDMVWTPDITIYNEVGLSYGKDPHNFLLSIESDGGVSWLYPRMLETSCKIEVSTFPHDTQRCPFQFGSWAMAGNLLDLTNKSASGDISKYIDNGEWILRGIDVERSDTQYDCCAGTYVDVTFTLVLQRRHLYYVFNLVLPCLIITLLATTTFLLPVESGEKISLSVTILLGLTVFLLLVADLMPAQSESIPEIVQYFATSIFLVSLTTAMEVFVLHLHFRGSRGFPAPKWVRSVIIEKLGYILLYGNVIENLSRPKSEKRIQTTEKNAKSQSNGTSAVLTSIKNIKGQPSENGWDDLKKVKDGREKGYDNYTFEYDVSTEMSNSDVIEYEDARDKNIMQEWFLVSLIVDRFFFVLVAIGNLAAIIFVLRPLVQSN